MNRGIYESAPPTLANLESHQLGLDVNGRLKVTTAPLASTTDEVSTVTKPLASSTGSNVSSSASNVTLLAANTARRSASIYNDSNQVLYVKFGATASTTSHKVQIGPKGYYEMPLPVYTGIIDGIWAAANGSARVVEGA
jgi:hypothetical protein